VVTNNAEPKADGVYFLTHVVLLPAVALRTTPQSSDTATVM